TFVTGDRSFAGPVKQSPAKSMAVGHHRAAGVDLEETYPFVGVNHGVNGHGAAVTDCLGLIGDGVAKGGKRPLKDGRHGSATDDGTYVRGTELHERGRCANAINTLISDLHCDTW